MTIGNTKKRPVAAIGATVVGMWFALATVPAAAQPIWANKSSNSARTAIELVAGEDTVPPAPPAEAGTAEPATDYEPQPAVSPPPVPEAMPAPASVTIVPPLPAPASVAMSTTPYAGRATVSHYCPPCPPPSRRRCCCEDEWDRRCIFGVPAHGMATRATFGAQIARADASQMMLYEYDFVPRSGELTLRGQYQLSKIATWAARSPFPIIVQSTPGDPSIAEARRQRVLEQLRAGGWVGPEEQVVIGLPLTPGLHGLDALPIAERLPYVTIGGGPIPAGPPAAGGAIPPGL